MYHYIKVYIYLKLWFEDLTFYIKIIIFIIFDYNTISFFIKILWSELYYILEFLCIYYYKKIIPK